MIESLVILYILICSGFAYTEYYNEAMGYKGDKSIFVYIIVIMMIMYITPVGYFLLERYTKNKS